jgi:stage II sporulation protein AA (anti-sigma F factor antagonist)
VNEDSIVKAANASDKRVLPRDRGLPLSASKVRFRLACQYRNAAQVMETYKLGNATVVRLIERIDSLSSQDVESALQTIIAGGARNIICDFAVTTYISSAGLRVLLVVAKTLKQAGGQLVIVCAKSGYVFEVLETAGFTTLIPVFESVADVGKAAA